jgi:hypothetical protein
MIYSAPLLHIVGYLSLVFNSHLQRQLVEALVLLTLHDLPGFTSASEC